MRMRHFSATLVMALLASCGSGREPAPPQDFYGTLEPFASEAVYFLLTDRFVDGDPSNNHVGQGGDTNGTFDRPIAQSGQPPANIGYLGGDFRGVLENADYIASMGFTAIWLTPVVDNPDEAFSGNRDGNDYGKTGYHGYWGVNFFELDEHLPSDDLDYAALTARLRRNHGLKTVLDVVCNHGSPSFTMPVDQPKYGELYCRDGSLVADHQNLHPSDLDPDNSLHEFFRREPDIGELSDLDYDNPRVLDYCVDASLKWLGQGAAAIRIDTIKHMPHRFWKAFGDRLREEYPGLFMFGEAFTYDPAELAAFTYPENGGNSVLDFAGREAMLAVFGASNAPYRDLLSYLHLDSGLYQNPYELMTFFDNHDMSRIDADAAGFIDAHNWLFTSRGIPVVYYGSEIGFRAGRTEHRGNRDYFGVENIAVARSHPVRAALSTVAGLRKNSISLQRGLQANVSFSDDTAVFFRVYQNDGVSETALVLLNRADSSSTLTIDKWLSAGRWRDAISGNEYAVTHDDEALDVVVPAHGIAVLLSESPVSNEGLIDELDRLQRRRSP